MTQLLMSSVMNIFFLGKKNVQLIVKSYDIGDSMILTMFVIFDFSS